MRHRKKAILIRQRISLSESNIRSDATLARSLAFAAQG
jgi:hypothetical protein